VPASERIRIERRPPERRWPPVVVGSVCCSTCCCCCCCLHTLGSVVGAAGASVVASADPSGRVATGIYWGALFLLAIPSGALVLVSDELSTGVIAYLILFPALQLAASLLALPLVALIPLENRGRALGAIGTITGASVVGAIGGSIVFAVLGGIALLFMLGGCR
jgi:hypothetical protein